MLVTYIRSSSWNNYGFCQMQYFISYVLGHQSPSGKRAEIGTICHKALEVLASMKLAIQNSGPRFKYAEINDDAIGKHRIAIDKFLTDETVNDIVKLSYNYYTAPSEHPWKASDLAQVYKLVWDTLYYNNGQFDPRYRKIVQPEPHFDIMIDEDWAKFDYTMPDGKQITGNLAIKGTIDLITEVDDGIIEIIDWKTGRRIDWATGAEKDLKKLKDDPQLLLYHYAISKMFPQYKQAIMTIFFIKDGGPFSLCFDESDSDRFLKMLRGKFESIKNNQVPRLIDPTRSNWKCSKLCHFYKESWPGSNKSMCEYVTESLVQLGMPKTVEACTKVGHSIGYYSAPG